MTEVQLCRCETWVLIGIQNALNFSTSVKIFAVASKGGISTRALLVKTIYLTGKENIGHWRLA